MIRIPAGNRFEFRLADGAVNPYLLPAVVLAAGLDGLESKIDPGPKREYDAYVTAPPKDVEILPSSLLESLSKLEASSEGLQKRIGKGFVKSYVKFRKEEWAEYVSKISQWEIEHTVDC